MVIGGLWHGASWNYVFWGAMHGFFLVLNHVCREAFPHIKINKLFCWLLTFSFVNATWVIFRSPDLTTAKNILLGLLGLNGVSVPPRHLNFFENFSFFPVISTQGIWQGIPIPGGTISFIYLIILCFAVTVFLPNLYALYDYDRKNENNKHGLSGFYHSRVFCVFAIILFWISIFNFTKPSPFLYFRF